MIQGPGGLVKFFGNVLRANLKSNSFLEINSKKVYPFTTALNDGDATTAPAGSLAWTSHATGQGLIFISDGSNWRVYFGQESSPIVLGAVPTTGNVSGHSVAPFQGKLVGVLFTSTDALVASDSNYITFSITNLGQAGSGNTQMLAATNPNTTKSTGGAALVAHGNRSLAVHGTAANLVVAQGDKLRFTATVTGTLGAQVTGGIITFIYQRNA